MRVASVCLLIVIGFACAQDNVKQSNRPVEQPGDPRSGSAGLPGAGSPGPGFPGKPVPGARRALDLAAIPGAINAGPHPSKASVIELLDDETDWLARQLHQGASAENNTKIGAWHRDRYSGCTALKVAGYQKYHETLPGWQYPIAEKPKEGEYRYIRFAWKKLEGRGIMVQLNMSGVEWIRYFAGENTIGFAPALQVSRDVPRDWTVVTRDLWADFQLPFTLTGIAFTAMDGIALFDHVYLGRSLADLDRLATARQATTKPLVLGDAQLMLHWRNISHPDAAIRVPSTWALANSLETSIPFLREHASLPSAQLANERLRKAMIDLDAPRYITRERAAQELLSYGLVALPYLEAAQVRSKDNYDLSIRLAKLVEQANRQTPQRSEEQLRWLQMVRILEHADRKTASPMLREIADANLPSNISHEAKNALERLNP